LSEKKRAAKAKSEKNRDSEKSGKSANVKLSQMQMSIKNMMVPKIDDLEASKIFGPMKAITAYSTAKALGINVSMASTLIKNLENRGILEKVGGYSGHYVYQYLSKSIK
jgi:small subunit ribosomal protein S25e